LILERTREDRRIGGVDARSAGSAVPPAYAVEYLMKLHVLSSLETPR